MDGFLSQYSYEESTASFKVPQNRGNMTMIINTSRHIGKGPYIDRDRILASMQSYFNTLLLYNGVIIHRITYLIPELERYPGLKRHFAHDIAMGTQMDVFDVPLKLKDPFGADIEQLVDGFCACMREYFIHKQRTSV